MRAESIVQDMKSCLQTDNLNVLQHGEMVSEYYKDLLSHLINGTKLQLQWKLPQWLYDYKATIIENLYSSDIMEMYHVYHDCGKPYCKTIDELGRQHFPNHATISGEISKVLFPNNDVVHRLIAMDMDIHILRLMIFQSSLKDLKLFLY